MRWKPPITAMSLSMLETFCACLTVFTMPRCAQPESTTSPLPFTLKKRAFSPWKSSGSIFSPRLHSSRGLIFSYAVTLGIFPVIVCAGNNLNRCLSLPQLSVRWLQCLLSSIVRCPWLRWFRDGASIFGEMLPLPHKTASLCSIFD